MLSLGVKLVLCGVARITVRSVPFVGVNDKRGVELAARHLLDLGHQRFGVIGLNASRAESGLPNRNYMQVRAQHFARTVLQAGIKPEHVTMLYTDTNDRASGRQLASHLLEQGPRARPSALFAVTDILALGALSEAASRGIAVPRGLSVVGFDDVPEAAAGR